VAGSAELRNDDVETQKVDTTTAPGRPRSLNDDGVYAALRDKESAGDNYRCEGQVIEDLTPPAPLCPATKVQGPGRCSDVINLHVTSPPAANSAPVVQQFSTAPALGANLGAFLDCLAVSSNRQESHNLLGRVAHPGMRPGIDNQDSSLNLQSAVCGSTSPLGSPQLQSATPTPS
ncbi:unnamed protein product, partial [Acanthoscelides obtectus]